MKVTRIIPTENGGRFRVGVENRQKRPVGQDRTTAGSGHPGVAVVTLFFRLIGASNVFPQRYSSACLKSATRSSGCSMPIETRIVRSLMPALRRASAVIEAWLIVSG